MADLPTVALSGYAPWFWAMLYGGKPYENRSPNFPRKHRGVPVIGDIWLHASQFPGRDPMLGGMAKVKWDAEFHAMDERRILQGVLRSGRAFGLGEPEHQQMLDMRGCIAGSIEVVRYVEPGEPVNSPWRFGGSLALEVRNPRPLPKPVPCKGGLGWWTVPENVMEMLRAQFLPLEHGR